MVSFCNGKIYTQSYENKQWKTKGAYYTILNSFIRNMELKELNNELYLIYSTGSKLSILKWNEQKATWNEVTSISDSVGDFSSNIIDNKLYISAITGEMADKASLYILNNNKIDSLGTYCNGMSGQPKVVSINNKIYVTTRLAASNKIKLYLYSNKSFSEIQNSMSSNTYDVKALNNKMYFVLGSDNESKLNIYKFDGSSWSNINSGINAKFPTLTVSQGNLYILARVQNTNVLVYSFNEKSQKFSQEGTIVDTAAQDSYLISIDNNIYVALYRSLDGSIAVKEKETVNSLMSLTIVPPKKRTYSVNEKIDTTGLQVIANYKKEQVAVTNFSIKGFDTSKPGVYNVTITYEGISNTFSYEVIGKGEVITDKPIIPDGTYIIESALNSNKVLDIKSGKVSKGTNVQLYDYNGTNAQKWNVKYLGNGYYSISSINNNIVMDVKGAGKSNGTNVQIWPNNNTSAQIWIIKSDGNGYFNIMSKCNNLYLDVAGGKISNGTNIQMYSGNNTKAQKFKFIITDEISDGEYRIESGLGKDMVLDVKGGKTTSGTNVQLYKSNGTNAQKWIIKKMSDGSYEIRSKLNNKMSLDVQGAKKSNKTNVQIWNANNTAAQRWIIKPTGDGYYKIISRCNNLCIDVCGGKTTNETNIQMYANANVNAQKFKFIKLK